MTTRIVSQSQRPQKRRPKNGFVVGQRDGPERRRRWECVEALKEVMPVVAIGVSALLLTVRAILQEPPTPGGASISHPNGCNIQSNGGGHILHGGRSDCGGSSTRHGVRRPGRGRGGPVWGLCRFTTSPERLHTVCADFSQATKDLHRDSVPMQCQ